MKKNVEVPKYYYLHKLCKRLILGSLCFIMVAACMNRPATAVADTENSGGVLHAFYPSFAVYSDQMQKYIDQVDSISFAWSRIDAVEPGVLNTVKGKNGNSDFYYPTDYLQPVEYAKSQGKSIQLNIYMNGSDADELLPFEDKRNVMIQAIVKGMQEDITQGEGICYDGVVIDFEGLRNTDSSGQSIYYQGEQISSCFTTFLIELKTQLESIGKTLYVAVNPGIYYDGFDYAGILDVADQMILMAHDYEPVEKLRKDQVQQYTGYNALEPINSLAPIQLIRQALNEISSAVSDQSELSKVWLQISFDSAQWQYDVDNANGWDALDASTLSRSGRRAPLYKSIKDRVNNIDGYGQNITHGYNNELQSPYIQYYNTEDQSWNVIIYEDSNSISSKIDLSKVYGLGGISVWSLSNIPDYNDTKSKEFHLDGWAAIISGMSSFEVPPTGSTQYISFADSTVELAIRDKLGKAEGKLTAYDLKSIYRLKLNQGVTNLKDLKALSNLEYLNAKQLGLKDISSISGLTKLRVLYLQQNKITNISALTKLTHLEILSLNGNQISDITGIKGLTKLQYLDLSNNKISEIKSLTKLTSLVTLYLQRNSISSISSISGLTKLKEVSFNGNKISTLKSLAKLTSLERLYLKDNKIKSITSLKGLINLKELYLGNNLIKDYNPVSKIYNQPDFQCDFKIG